MKNFILLSLLAQFILAAHAQEDDLSTKKEEICKQWNERKTQKQISKNKNSLKKSAQILGVFGRILFLKNSVVGTHVFNIEDLMNDEEFLSKRESKSEVKIYTSGLSDEMSADIEKFNELSKIFKAEKKNLKSFRKRTSEILEKVKSIEECRLEVDKLDFKEMSRIESYFKGNAQLQNEINNSKIFKISEKASKKYSNEKVERAVIETLGSHLKLQTQSVAVLTLHASEDGRLFDANYNQIPISTFKEMSSNIKTLILYSCHPDAVVEKYKLKELVKNKKINLVIPTLHKSLIPLLHENIPAPFLEIFLKKAIKHALDIDQKEKITLNEDCKLEIQSKGHLVKGRLGVFLNQHFIGFIQTIESSLYFDCRLLKENNIIVTQNMNLLVPPTLADDKSSWDVIINDKNHGSLNHFFNDKTYISSKGVVRY